MQINDNEIIIIAKIQLIIFTCLIKDIYSIKIFNEFLKIF